MEHCSKCSLTLLLAIVATSFYLWHQQAGLNRSKNWISISRPDNFQFDYPHIDEPTERNFCTPLSGRELDLYKKCYAHVYEEKIFKRFGPIVEGDCCFMNGSGRLVVGLGSFPGSGNTWLRGLLEKTTGICTGIQATIHAGIGWSTGMGYVHLAYRLSSGIGCHMSHTFGQ